MALACTFTVITQVVFAGITPAVKAKLAPFAVAASVPVHPAVLLAAAKAAAGVAVLVTLAAALTTG